jgi:hypothetical protein
MSDAILKMDTFAKVVMVGIGLWNKKKKAYNKISVVLDTGVLFSKGLIELTKISNCSSN